MQLKAEYEKLLQRHNYTYNMYAAFTYDAAWSIALMLNKSIPLLQEKNQTLETMSYRDKEAAKVMRDTLFRTDFWGMSVCTFVMSSLPLYWKISHFFSASFDDNSANINDALCSDLNLLRLRLYLNNSWFRLKPTQHLFLLL